MVFLVKGVKYMIFSFLDSEDYFRMMTFVSKKFILDFDTYKKYGGIVPDVLIYSYIMSGYCRPKIVKNRLDDHEIRKFMYLSYLLEKEHYTKYFFNKGYIIKCWNIEKTIDKIDSKFHLSGLINIANTSLWHSITFLAKLIKYSDKKYDSCTHALGISVVIEDIEKIIQHANTGNVAGNCFECAYDAVFFLYNNGYHDELRSISDNRLIRTIIESNGLIVSLYNCLLFFVHVLLPPL